MDLHKLNVMNYQVDTEDGHYYIATGTEGLDNFAATYGILNTDLYLYLLNNGQYVDPTSGDSITMI